MLKKSILSFVLSAVIVLLPVTAFAVGDGDIVLSAKSAVAYSPLSRGG